MLLGAEPHHEGRANSLHGQCAISRIDQNQSSLASIYASATPAATQAQETNQFVPTLRSSVQAQSLERPTASSIAEGRHNSYWETLTTNNRSFRPLESDLCREKFEQSSNWAQSLSLDPVNFLDYLPSTAPAESLPLNPVNFLDYLSSSAPNQPFPTTGQTTLGQILPWLKCSSVFLKILQSICQTPLLIRCS